MMEKNIYRGEVYWVAIDNFETGSEIAGKRPAIILQNNQGNLHSKTTIVAFLTSRIEKHTYLPTHVFLKHRVGLPRNSFVMLEQIRTVSLERLGKKLITVTPGEMKMIDLALKTSVGLGEF